jgi:hypothetical protein
MEHLWVWLCRLGRGARMLAIGQVGELGLRSYTSWGTNESLNCDLSRR